MDCVLATEKEYKELLRDAMLYRALDRGGVDNWSWFGASIQDFLDSAAAQSIEDLVDKRIDDMKLITIGEVEESGL